MDLTLMGLLLSMAGLTLQRPGEYMAGVYADPDSRQNRAMWYHGTEYDHPNESMEEKLRRIDLQGNPNLEYLFNRAQVPLGPIKKREVIPSGEQIDPTNEFIEEKLIEHSQALEQLVKMVRKNEDITKQLLENISKLIDRPKIPEKLEIPVNTRRFNKVKHDDHQVDENPIVRIGKNLSKYGSLLRSLVVQEVQEVADATPIIEIVNRD